MLVYNTLSKNVNQPLVIAYCSDLSELKSERVGVGSLAIVLDDENERMITYIWSGSHWIPKEG
nr:MAG TPA: hypothetical protein [Caudoviricetes sp.]